MGGIDPADQDDGLLSKKQKDDPATVPGTLSHHLAVKREKGKLSMKGKVGKGKGKDGKRVTYSKDGGKKDGKKLQSRHSAEWKGKKKHSQHHGGRTRSKDSEGTSGTTSVQMDPFAAVQKRMM